MWIRKYALALLQIAALLAVITIAFIAGYSWPRSLTRYEQVYENGKRAAFQEMALCTIEAAHDELCAIPCATDTDCLAKNGQTDH